MVASLCAYIVEPVKVSLPETLAFWLVKAFQVFLRMFFKCLPATFGAEEIRITVEIGRCRGIFGIDPHATDRVHVRLFGLLQVHDLPPVVGAKAARPTRHRFS